MTALRVGSVSRSVFACRNCGHVLGYRHHSGRLRTAPGITACLDAQGRTGPVVRLICPVCRRQRDYRDGSVVVPGADGTAAIAHDPVETVFRP